MGDAMTIEYRHPTLADAEAMTDVANRSSREIPLRRDITLEEFKRWNFEEDDYKTDGYLLAILDGKIIAYGGTTIQKSRQESGMNDAFIDLAIVPEHRDKGIQSHIVNFSIDYLKKHGIKYAKRWAIAKEGWRHDASLEAGMRDIRHGYTMVYDKDVRPAEVPVPEGIKFNHINFADATDDEIADFVHGFNDSFSEHYNFSPQPLERFIKYRDTEENPNRITMAMKNDEVIAVLMVEVAEVYNKEKGKKTGRANILGVTRSCRKMGIGRARLSDGMCWVWDQGMDTIYLGMDAENRKALVLYTDLGYRVDQESIFYQLDL